MPKGGRRGHKPGIGLFTVRGSSFFILGGGVEEMLGGTKFSASILGGYEIFMWWFGGVRNYFSNIFPSKIFWGVYENTQNVVALIKNCALFPHEAFSWLYIVLWLIHGGRHYMQKVICSPKTGFPLWLERQERLDFNMFSGHIKGEAGIWYGFIIYKNHDD